MAERTELTRKERAEPPRREERRRVPAVDIREMPDRLILSADLPGVAEDGVEVSVEENTLTVKGRIASAPVDRAALVHAEYEPLPFERSFTLSNDLDLDAIEGKMKNGVLTVTIPKSPSAQVRKVPIKTV